MRKILVILIGGFFLSSVIYAKQQQRPVAHAHNGKKHTHVLPNNGRGHHNHRRNHKTKRALYNKKVAHTHNGRRHYHVLPNGQRNHSHSRPRSRVSTSTNNKSVQKSETSQIKKTSHLNIFTKTYNLNPDGWHIPALGSGFGYKSKIMNGYGTVRWMNDDFGDWIVIKGEFNNGKLITGVMEIRRLNRKIDITSSSDIKGIIESSKKVQSSSYTPRKSYSSSSNRGGGGDLCVPSIPYKNLDKTECETKSASGTYATVKLMKDSTNCYTLEVYSASGSGSGNTCSGVSGGWAVSTSKSNGIGNTNDLSSAISWVLKRL